MTAAKVCTCGRPMRVELSRRVAGGNGARVVLWYCEACDHAEHEIRQAIAVAVASARRAPLLWQALERRRLDRPRGAIA